MPKIVDSELKKAEISALAYTVLVNEGVENFSLNKFIASLGVSKGQFYHYFNSKESLIFGALEIKGYEFMELTRERIASKDTFLEKLFEFFSFYINDTEQVYIEMRKITLETMHLYLGSKYPEAIKSCEGMYLTMQYMLDEIFDYAIENKELTQNAKQFSKALFAAIDGMYMQSIAISNYSLKGEATDFLINIERLLKKA